MLKIISTYTENGIPKTGLVPKIKIYNTDNGDVIISGLMEELQDGFYKYIYNDYVAGGDYLYQCDAGDVLSDTERYQSFGLDSYISTDVWATTVSGYDTTTYGEAIALIRMVEIGKWEISGSVLTFFDSDNTTAIASFTLDDPTVPTTRTPV